MPIFSDDRYEKLFRSAQVKTNNANLTHKELILDHNKKLMKKNLIT